MYILNYLTIFDVFSEFMVFTNYFKTMKKQAAAAIPTQWGTFQMIAYSDDDKERMPHLAIVHPAMNVQEDVVVRIHSECLTGDLFTSKRCDCGEQLHVAMEMIAKEKGALIYLRQEGRGIGIINKLKAYNLQDDGLNTIDANTHLGFEPDARHYDPAIQILQDLGITSIQLLTNNPLKVEAFEKTPIQVNERLPIVIPAHQDNHAYLKTKNDLMGHFLNL